MSERALRLVSELVAIDSTSAKSNLPVIELLEAQLRRAGLPFERQSWVEESGVVKANLVVRVGEGLPELALVGHTDCVPFDASWKDALALTERDGKLYGRGSADTKSYVACAVAALERCASKLTRPALLLFTADEELGCVGAKKLVEAGLGRCKRAIIGEPTGLSPVRANKGYCLAEVEVRGKEGHSAYPDTGASAIFRAARLINRLEAYAAGPLRRTTAAGFVPPFPTLNVGVISGGKAKNIIAGACRFTLEWRPLPGQRVEEVLRDVVGFIDALKAEEPGFEATVSPLRTDQGFNTAADEDVVRFLERESGNASHVVSFGTEGPQLEQLGAKSVVFGPGDITVAHQSFEFVPKAEVERAQQILEQALLTFCAPA